MNGHASVRFPLDDVDRMIRGDQCVAGHAAPSWQVHASPGITCDDLKSIPSFHLVHTKTEFDDELPAADLTGVPTFAHDRPFRDAISRLETQRRGTLFDHLEHGGGSRDGHAIDKCLFRIAADLRTWRTYEYGAAVGYKIPN